MLNLLKIVNEAHAVYLNMENNRYFNNSFLRSHKAPIIEEIIKKHSQSSQLVLAEFIISDEAKKLVDLKDGKLTVIFSLLKHAAELILQKPASETFDKVKDNFAYQFPLTNAVNLNFFLHYDRFINKISIAENREAENKYSELLEKYNFLNVKSDNLEKLKNKYHDKINDLEAMAAEKQVKIVTLETALKEKQELCDKIALSYQKLFTEKQERDMKVEALTKQVEELEKQKVQQPKKLPFMNSNMMFYLPLNQTWKTITKIPQHPTPSPKKS